MLRPSALVPLSVAVLSVVALATSALGCVGADPAVEPLGFEIDPTIADTAVFAGGCFWCMEKPFETLDGVASVVSGFSGGSVPNPTYEQVSTKTTGHYESVEVVYDPSRVSYETLLRTYWHNVDPFDGAGQFCDRGAPYRPAIFVRTDEERQLAEAQKAAVAERFGEPVAVEVLDGAPFYAAEAYHQDFYRTNPAHYQSYRTGCRRDDRLEAVWGEAAGHTGDVL